MLAVQVQYWNLQEEKRHNQATEEETNRHNVATELETRRHNVETEALGWASLAETTRHNMATEDISRRQVDELERHNRATESLGWANVAVAQENTRIAWYNAETSRLEYGLHTIQTSLQEQKINNDYALGLQANEIAQQNANTNYQRMINDASLGWANFGTRQQEVAIKRGELDLNRTKYEHQRIMDIWSNMNQTLNSAGKIGFDSAGLVMAAGL